LTTRGTTTAKVFTKLGEYARSEMNAANWTLVQTTTVTGASRRQYSDLFATLG
jgi:hypothetical protein